MFLWLLLNMTEFIDHQNKKKQQKNGTAFCIILLCPNMAETLLTRFKPHNKQTKQYAEIFKAVK